MGLAQYFSAVGYEPFPEFSVPHGRIDLFAINSAQTAGSFCEVKHCYLESLGGVLGDFERLASYDFPKVLADRAKTVLQEVELVFVGAGMSDTRWVFESLADKAKLPLAIDYLERYRVREPSNLVESLHGYLGLEGSRLSFFENVSGENKYWVVVWSCQRKLS